MKYFAFSDFQKLEREARICRKLQHPNIGNFITVSYSHYYNNTPHTYTEHTYLRSNTSSANYRLFCTKKYSAFNYGAQK